MTLTSVLGQPQRHGDAMEAYPLFETMDSIQLPDELFLGERLKKRFRRNSSRFTADLGM